MANTLVKRAYEDEELTEFQMKEIIKCADDCQYFMESYIKVQHPIRGSIPFVLYDYQERVLDNVLNNSKNIILQPRQSGKCCSINSNITVRNKLTGEIETITIGEFYAKCKDNTKK